MTRDKVISILLSMIKIIVLLFITAYLYKYLMSLEQEVLNSLLIIVFLINMIKILTEWSEKNEKVKNEKMMIIQIFTLVFFAIIDCLSTNYGLVYGATELNPIMENLISTSFGIFIKIFLTGVVGIYLYFRQAKKTLFAVNLIMLLICLNNILVIMNL